MQLACGTVQRLEVSQRLSSKEPNSGGSGATVVGGVGQENESADKQGEVGGELRRDIGRAFVHSRTLVN